VPTNRRRIRPGRRYDDLAELNADQEQQLLTGMAFGKGFPDLEAFEEAWERHCDRLRGVAAERAAEFERKHGFPPDLPGAFADRLLIALRRRPGLRAVAEQAFRDGGYGRRAADGLRQIAGDVPAQH
jgi:hypothetical protein